ncbi:di-heme-cytochrome C peroxidase [Bradyrhizobium sp. RDM4]|uniref:di-heme-cytochrome C peroxidase n=1 Tax=Bradyrhizobium sp. RDM4 TaxID=3378765 RepID=UPI0038FC1E15
MHDPTSKPFVPSIEVSPDNPCPFLRGLVGEGFVAGGTVPLNTLSQSIGAASGETGFKKVGARIAAYLIALGANGALHLPKSIFSGAQLDQLRNGPLDKHGAGSRILNEHAVVQESEIERLASFGRDYPDPCGGVERGLNEAEITTYMRANLARADNKRWYFPILMKGEWPVLLNILGKGEGKNRYLSVAEVRTLFEKRKLPARIEQQLLDQPVLSRGQHIARGIGIAAAALVVVALAIVFAVAEFPNQVRAILPEKFKVALPPPLPRLPRTTTAYWLEQNWSLEDRYWFHHVSQGTATFPVPYAWFVALEQPTFNLFSRNGMLKDSAYLERFGFIPSPQTIHTDETTLRRFGYANVYDTNPAPPPSGLWKTPVENVDGLPVGFARLTGVLDPASGRREEDKIGLTCAACHTGHIRYKGVDVRFDGGPAMTDLKKLELVTGLSIVYTWKLPTRFKRFADRVLGPNAGDVERHELKQKLGEIGQFLLDWQNTYNQTIAGKKSYDGKEQQRDTEEGFGRLDALNRIGNQVFSQDFALSGVGGFEKNLHAQDAPVSFPPIWTVPWFKFAQYDASIEQPLIRNAGEALGVTALLNLSDGYAPDKIWRSSVALQNLEWIERLIAGPDTLAEKKFSGLQAPKWPSQLFGDSAWKIDDERVSKGRKLYAEMCAGCHLGPVNDPAFDQDYSAKSLWSPDSKRWETSGTSKVLDPIQIPVTHVNTDPGQAEVLMKRTIEVPGFLKVDPTRQLTAWWDCKGLKSTAEMPYSLALMTTVDLVARKWMSEAQMPQEQQKAWWGARQNCPNPTPVAVYRTRPLNGVWATAPYLHNGSVPSLYWLLKPAAERPKKFCMGMRDYDPKQVGFAVVDGETCKTGETQFTTTWPDGRAVAGNKVEGHSFEGASDAPKKDGVIGRGFKDDEERYDLIEYLKTL